MFRKGFFFFCALLIMWGIIFFYNRVTDGFSVREMHSSLGYNEAFDVTPPPQMVRNELDKVFDQEYRYLGKGCQFYAFESQDKKYVIKFFKHKHLRQRDWLKELPIPSRWRPYCDNKIAVRQKRVMRLFSSCKLAYEELGFETGILYLHLNKTPSGTAPRLTLRDKLNIRHTIDLDDFEFVVQRRALQVKEAFETLCDEKEVKKKVQQLIDIVKLRCERGIINTDRSFAQNVAFCIGEERAVFIDVGQFAKDEAIKSDEACAKEIKRRLGALRYWMNQHYPHLTPLVDQEIANVNYNCKN